MRRIYTEKQRRSDMHLTETALRETMRLLETRDAPAARAANDTSSDEVTSR
jgi:hypothetical protein